MKNIRLYQDETIDLDLEKLAKNLNDVSQNIKFIKGKTIVNIEDEIISYPDTYHNISELLINETKDDYKAVIITRKRYDNNYFFTYSGNLVILSFFAWEQLTTLPLSNGVVFFIADFLSLHIDHSFRHYENDEKPKPECIYDFGWNKTGVDIGMRSAMICPTCIKRINGKRLTDEKIRVYKDLKLILNDLGNASKWETDILEYWSIKLADSADKETDRKSKNRNQVFISYSREDSMWLNKIKTFLKPFERNDTIHVWEDTRIKTGRDWRQEIENALQKTKIAVLMLSKNFLASDFIINNELPHLLSAAEKNGTIIMPIILKPCNFTRFPDLCKFQSVNKPSKTLVEMDEGEQDRLLSKLTEDILDELAYTQRYRK